MNDRTQIPVRRDGKVAYWIYLEEDFSQLAFRLTSLGSKERRLCLVTDSNVDRLCGDTVFRILESCSRAVTRFVFPAGEASKNLDTVQRLYEHLILSRYERRDLLVALGGGVVGDLTGYAAATYLRGIDYVQIPTTLLAQVDSSIGGKTGVDFDRCKNMIGAFHMPKLVYANLNVLQTLSAEQFACGMGEILKHGLIKDRDYYLWTAEHKSAILAREIPVLKEMVARSCEIKREVVEKDPTEQGERALLNFGHTLGHAIEKQKNFTLLHGQCVALGCLAAAYLSERRGLIRPEDLAMIREQNIAFCLPVTFDGPSPEEILAATRSDKKTEQGKVKFILLSRIGQAYIDRSVTDEEMTEALAFIRTVS